MLLSTLNNQNIQKIWQKYSLVTNLPTNMPNLCAPTSSSKKSKTHVRDSKKQLEFERMLYKNATWWKANDTFQKLSKKHQYLLGAR
jgi:hypothetical protein